MQSQVYSSIRMSLGMPPLVFLLVLLSVAYSSEETKHVFHTHPATVENSTIWYDGTDSVNYPCSTSSLANENLSETIDLRVNEDSTSPLKAHDCPLWMYSDKETGKCKCMYIPYSAVHCDPTIPRTTLLDCFCMTYNNQRNQTELGRCVYGCARRAEDTVYNSLPNNTAELNEFMCGYSNRNSTLCGKCEDGYSPLVYSYNIGCKNCTGMNYNWLKYIAVAYIPLTVFFLFVAVTKFSGTSPLMRAFITACQGLTSPVSVRVALYATSGHTPYIGTFIRIISAIYGVWNLDFFRTVIPPICLDITPLQAQLLDYAVAVYPMLLVVITYILIRLHSRDVRIVIWLWKPFKRICNFVYKDWEMQGSVINAFATFLLLSYLRIVSVSFDLLIYTELYTSNGSGYNTSHALYYDASVEFFGEEHLPYAIAAICVSVTFTLLPLLFLILYPMQWFQRCLNALQIRRQSIDMFVNCFQGYYKDGTEGTRDCRYFSVMWFLAQIIIFGFFSLSRSAYCYAISALVLIVFSVFTLFCQPYKEQFKAYTSVDITMLLTVASLFLMTAGADIADTKAEYFSKFSYCLVGAIAFVPLVYFVIVSTWWVFVKKKLGQKIATKLRACVRRSDIDQLSEAESVPDRLKNPMDYPVQVPRAPMHLPRNAVPTGNPSKYGTVN